MDTVNVTEVNTFHPILSVSLRAKESALLPTEE